MIGEPDLPSWAYNFFTGVPAPAAAGLVLVPMMLSFQIDSVVFSSPVVNAVALFGVSFLMVSKTPTFSGKRFRVPHNYVLPVLLLVGVLAAFLVTEPWTTITVITILYGVSIPLSVRSFSRLKKQAAALRTAEEPTASDVVSTDGGPSPTP